MGRVSDCDERGRGSCCGTIHGGQAPRGRRLFYFDSERTDEAPEGNLDELVHEGGVFKGFAPGPDRRKEDKS